MKSEWGDGYVLVLTFCLFAGWGTKFELCVVLAIRAKRFFVLLEFAMHQKRLTHQPKNLSRLPAPLSEFPDLREYAGLACNREAANAALSRVICGTIEQNTAQLWMTLFFLGSKPPENITLHGANDFGSGGEIGSASVASPAFSAYMGKQFKRVANTLTIG